MSVTVTELKTLNEEVMASAQDGTYVYYGTNAGNIYKYAISGGAITLIASAGASVQSMSLYSGVLYVGCLGGKMLSVTTS